MTQRRVSVAALLAAALVAVTTAALGVMAAVTDARARRVGHEQLRAALVRRADQLAVALELPIWNIDRPQIDRILDSLEDAPDLEAVSIEAAGRAHGRLRDAAGRWTVSTDRVAASGLLVERRPVVMDGELVGSLTVYATPRALEQELAVSRAAMLLTIVAVDGLLILSLYLVLWRLVLRPLRMIERYAGSVSAGGDTSPVLPVAGFRGELAGLRDSISAMVAQLDERFRQLRAEVRQREEREAARQASERRYRELVDFSPMGILQERRDGTIIMANHAAARLVGYGSVEEVLAHNTSEFQVDPGARERLIASFDSDRGAPSAELHIRRRDGSTFWARTWSRVMRGPGGRVECFETFFHDVTVRKRAEEALSASEERYRLLFDGSPIPMLVHDLDSLRFLAANRAAEQQYGWPREQLLEMSLPDLYAPGDESLARSLALRFEPRPELLHVGQRQHRRRDGGLIDIDVTSLSVAYDGRTAQLLLLRDVTAERHVAEERARLEESLRRNERMSAMGALVAGVAHEVRNPLFSISATVDALGLHLEGQPKFGDLTGLLRSQVARLNRLMQDLLDYGKPPLPRFACVDPCVVLRQAVRACATLASSRGVALDERFAPGLPMIAADAGRIEQVFENLLANALQHSPRGSRVTLQARADGAVVEFTVSDEGPGIPAADLPRLFEPFFTRRPDGTGLGLAIVQRIVEAHDGQLSVDNRAERGAAFTVRLPTWPSGLVSENHGEGSERS